MFQDPCSAEGQARGVLSCRRSATHSLHQSGSSYGVSSEKGLQQHNYFALMEHKELAYYWEQEGEK